MKNKSLLAALALPAFVLLIPLIGMQISDQWQWGPGDFLVAYLLMSGVGLAFRWFALRSDNLAYRLGAALALLAAFLIVWVSAAVGIIGAENPGNLLYGVVLLVALAGACLARFAAGGMARVLLVTACIQTLVPGVAYLFWPSDFSPGVAQVFALNSGFAALFAGSALLFRRAARPPLAARISAA